MTKERFSLPPMRLSALAPWFAWIMCLFLSPANELAGLAARTIDPGANPLFLLVTGHVLFLVACSAALAGLVAFERRSPHVLQGWGMRLVAMAAALACGGTALAKSLVLTAGLGVPAPTVAGVQAAAVVAGYLFAGVANALFYWAFGKLYGSVSIKLSMRSIPFSAAVGAVVCLLAAALPAVPSTVLVCLLPAAVGFFLWVARGERGGSGADVQDTPKEAPASPPARPERTVANTAFVKWRITGQIAVYWFSFGVMWTLAMAGLPRGAADNLKFAATTSLLVLLMALVVMVSGYVYKKSTVKTFWLFVPFVVVGIAAVAVLGEAVQAVAFAMLFAARLVAEVQLIVHFSALGRKNGYPTTLLFGRGFGMLVLGEAAGVLVGIPLVSLSTEWLSVALLLVLSIAVTVLITSILRVNSTLQRSELAAALAQAEAKASEAATAGPEALAQSLARAHAFSARETEVTALLLAGRSAPYIAEQLGIGLSTVNTHVKHIYEKAGVHNRQELIDLGEHERRASL